MEANTGITTVVQQPVTEPVTFKIHKPLKRSSVKSTAIIQIVFAVFCLLLGIWIFVTSFANKRRRDAASSLMTLSVWLYIPSGAVGLRAASNNNICAVVAYQTMSLFGCIFAAFHSLYFFIQFFVPFRIVSDILTFACILAICIAAGIGTSTVQKSTGCCCAKYPAETEPVVMRSNALNTVAPMPQQQLFTVQHGMNAGPPPVQQPNPNVLNTVSYFN